MTTDARRTARRLDRERLDPRLVALGGGLALVAAVGALGSWSSEELARTVRWVDHTHGVLAALGRAEQSLTRLDALKRAYVLTGDERELAQFGDTERRLDDAVRSIRRMTADNPERQVQLESLMPLLRERREQLHRGIALRRTHGFDAAREQRTIAIGERTGGEIRQLLAAMSSAERALLASRDRETRRGLSIARVVQLIGAVAGFAVVAFAFAGMRREIRLRTASAAALQVSEQNLATTLHSIGDGVIATDASAAIVRMNPVAEALTGWTAADALGKPFVDVFQMVDERTGEPAPDPVARVLREGVPCTIANETLLLGRGGKQTPIADSAAPIRDVNGAITGAVVVFRDAGAERAWEAKIREAHAFLDSIVENTPSMVFVKDARDLRFVRVNRAAEEILRRPRESLIGKTDHDFFPREQAEAFQAADREALRGEGLVDVAEEPVETPVGTRWLHTRKIVIRGADGAPAFLLGLSEDVTEQRAMRNQLRQINELLERRVEARTDDLVRANERLARESDERQRTALALARSQQQLQQAQKMEAIGRLAGGVAHDFNNLLSIILSYSAILIEELDADHPARPDLEQIHAAGVRAADLTRQLLAFSRQQVLAPRVVNLGAIVLGMEKLLARVIGEDIELRTVVSPRAGNVRVDPGQIEQVIMNLVVNARDAMPRGGEIAIQTTSVQIDEEQAAAHGVSPGRYCLLAVTDTGTGMDRETQARIFEPFFTTKEVGRGTGLGLSMVLGIVQQSGGQITMASELGAGTAFKIYFPEVTDSVTSSGRIVRPSVRGSETVLLVEDEEPVRALARNILTRAGYRVLEASGGEDALRVADGFDGVIHLVVTDVVMPRMSGSQLVADLAARQPSIKVLFISGYTDDAVVHHGVSAHDVAFLQKPITPDSLTRRVREVLDDAGVG